MRRALAVPGVGDLTIPDKPLSIITPFRGALRRIELVLAGFSNAVELKVLEDIVGKTTYTVTAPIFLALATSAVAETDTSASVVDATYTGYARKSVAASDWNSAAAGAISTANTLTFANCTALTSTIIGWALCSVVSGAGDVIMFGTCASTVISTTQTPATVAAGALSLTLD